MPDLNVADLGALKIKVAADFEQWKRDQKRAAVEAKNLGKTASGALQEGWKAGLQHTERETENFFARLGRKIKQMWDTMVASTLEKGAVATIAAAKAMRILSESTRDAEGELTKFGKATKIAADGLDIMATMMIKAAEAALRARLTIMAATAALATAALVARAKFQPEWNRVITLLGDTSQVVIDDLDRKLNKLAATLGVDIVESTQAFYNILSAMPQLVKQPERALGILEAALQVSATGFGDASTAGKAITTVLNAFGLEAESATAVADALFATQDQGVTTFGELAEEIGRVADITANLEGSFEDVLAVVATITPKGQETNQVLTNLRSLMVSIIGASPEMRAKAAEIGVQLSAEAIAAEGLVGWLTKLIEVTDGDLDVIAQFITSQEGLALVSSLTKETGTLAEKLEVISNAAGKTAENVETMNESFSRQKEIFAGLLASQLRRFGKPLEEAAAGALGVVNSFLEEAIGYLDLLEEHRPFQIQTKDAEEFGGVVGWLIGRLEELNAQAPWLVSPSASPQAYQTLQQGVTSRVAPPSEARADDSLIKMGKIRYDRLRGTGPTLSDLARPESAEFVAEDVKRTKALAELEALLHLRRTGNHEEYTRMMEEAQEASNALLLTEIKRLEEAGVEKEEIATLLGLYQELKRTTGDADAAKTRLAQQTALYGMAEGFADASPSVSRAANVPDDLLAKMRQVLALETQMAQVEKDLALLGPGDGDLRDRAVRFLAELAGEAETLRTGIAGVAVDLGKVTTTLIDRLDARKVGIGGGPGDTGDLATFGTDFGLDALMGMEDQARRLLPLLEDLRDARRELNLVLLDTTSTSEDVAAARQKVADAEAAARKKTVDLVATNKRHGMTQKQLNELLDTYVQLLREAGIALQEVDDTFTFADKAEIAGAIAKGLLSAADAAGVLDESLRKVLRGISDIADGSRLMSIALAAANPNPIALIGAGVQIGGGILNFISGLRGGGSDDSTRRLVESQAELILAIEGLTDAFLGTVSASRRDELRDFASDTLAGADGDPKSGLRKFTAEELAKLKQIEEILGESLIGEDLEVVLELLEKFLSLEFAAFGPGVEGAFQEVQFVLDVLGDAAGDAAAQLRLVVDALKDTKGGKFAAEALRIFQEDGAQAMIDFVNEAALAIAAGGTELEQLIGAGGLLEGMSPTQAQEFISSLDRWTDAVAAESPEGTTSSFQVVRTITETTAGVLISEIMTTRFWVERGTLALEAMLQIMQGGRPIISPDELGVVDPGSVSGGIGTVNLTVNFEGPLIELNTTGGVDQDELVATARRAGTAAAEQIDTTLKQNFTNHVRSIGR